MNLKQFAQLAGVEITSCNPDDGWNGPIGWTTKDSPNIQYCGFQSEDAAYEDWLERQFDKRLSIAIRQLLQGDEVPKQARFPRKRILSPPQLG